MTRRLLYLAALVIVLTAVVIGLAIPSREGVPCSPPSAFDQLPFGEGQSPRPDPCWLVEPDHRIPLRAGIIGGGLVLGLGVAAVASRQK